MQALYIRGGNSARRVGNGPVRGETSGTAPGMAAFTAFRACGTLNLVPPAWHLALCCSNGQCGHPLGRMSTQTPVRPQGKGRYQGAAEQIRALDWWGSAASSGSFLASSLFLLSNRIHARPNPLTQTIGPVSRIRTIAILERWSVLESGNPDDEGDCSNVEHRHPGSRYRHRFAAST
jgi:hypothetical protein